MPTVKEVTFNLLRKLGVTTVVGNPGSTEETFLKNFPDDFDYVMALQEASVVGIPMVYPKACASPSSLTCIPVPA